MYLVTNRDSVDSGELMSRMREDVTSSEMRHDWLADRWVIIAPQRTARPCDFDLVFDEPSGVGDCPFCCGHEAETPLAVASYPAISANRKKESCAEWSVRVVPNKFPAVNIPGTRPPMRYATHPASPVPTNGINLFKRRGLSGGHEVIVESPISTPFPSWTPNQRKPSSAPTAIACAIG